MPDVTGRLGLKKPLGNETVSRAAYNENLDIIDQNAAILGLDNQAINKSKAVTLETDTRTTETTYNVDGYIETETEKDGATVVKTTTYTYDPVTKYLTQKVEVAGGTTTTTTYTYTDGKLTSDAKAVA